MTTTDDDQIEAKPFTPEEQAGWDRWVASRPPSVQALCKRLPPNKLYLLKTTDQIVHLYSYNEDGTVTVLIKGDYNLVTFERQVFGINPDDLEPCAPPPDGKKVGVLFTTEDQIRDFTDRVRPQVLAGRGMAQIEREEFGA